MLKIRKIRPIILINSLLIFAFVIGGLGFFEKYNKVLAATCGDIYAPLPDWLKTRLQENKSSYVLISEETGVPWQMLAAIHYRENNMARYNPWNGYGIFQFTPPPEEYEEGPVTYKEFRRQLRYMAKKIQTDYAFRNSPNSASVSPRKLTANEKDTALIKNTLFSYNGRADVYAAQAEKYGFNRATRPYEGSPYVMNMFDCKRSSMGIITQDYGSIDGKDTRYGAFTLYARLKGDAYWKSLQGVEFGKMKTPRWMEVIQTTKKLNPYTGELTDEALYKGRQIYFNQTIKVDGKTYLRTSHDSKYLYEKGVLLERLKEVPVNYTPLKNPRWMETTRELYKIDPRTKQKIGSAIPTGTKLYYPTLTSINDTLYLRTQADTHNGQQTGIPIDSLNSSPVTYESFSKPRWLVATRNTQSYDLKYPSASTSPTIPADSKLYYNYKTSINGRSYATSPQPPEDEYVGTNLNHLRSISSDDFRSLKHQRAYRLLETVKKTDQATGQAQETSIAKDTTVYFQTLVNLGGTPYLRSARDTQNNYTTTIPLDKVTPVDVTFKSMDEPRRMRIKTSTKKVDPVTLQQINDTISAGSTVVFSQKLSIDGKLYLRTHHDSEHGHFKVIRFSALEEL